MDDSLLVRSGEAGANLPRDLESLVGGQAADAAQQRSKVFPIHIFHREKGLAVGLADVEDAADVGMGHLARHADFVVNRARRRFVPSEDCGRNFSATVWPRFISSARYTSPMPPLPSRRNDAIAIGERGTGNVAMLESGIGAMRRSAARSRLDVRRGRCCAGRVVGPILPARSNRASGG